MAIIRKTVIDQIEITRKGGYQIRLNIVIEEDGVDDEETRKNHRTSVWNSDEVDATMALVNTHLVQMKAAPLPQSQINRIKNIIIAVEGVIGFRDPPPPPPVPGP